ncbi:MAG: ribonuclease P protein component [Candidatus Dormibacteria bacterium]
MKRKFRLRDGRDFRRVIEARRSAGGDLLVVYFRRSTLPVRVGVTVSRKIPGAVERNRIKRRLRELARLHLLARVETGDIVLVGRPAAAGVAFGQLEEELHRLMSRLQIAGAPGVGR